MILINRIVDNHIMNDRQSNDWHRKAKLQEYQDEYDNLPPNATQEVKDLLLAMIADLQTQYDAWKQQRIDAVVNIYGGLVGDYTCVDVPDDEKQTALTCRYITYDGDILTYNTDPLMAVAGSVITVSKGWAQGNYILDADDVTDFSTLGNIEDVFFKLCFYRNGSTVSVMLFTRLEHEDFGDPASGIFCGDICHGVVHADQSLDLY